jgi:hypothetical protein
MACEEDQELWEEIDETDDYVRLPNQYELHEKSIMEKFAYESGNKRVSEVMLLEEGIRTGVLKIK